MIKTAEEVEREVEASRSSLDRTVEALKDKMTPGQLLDEATRAMGTGGQQVISKFMEQAKENPMPLAVMGLGLAWLMSSSGRRSRSSSFDEPRSFADRAQTGLGGASHDLGEKAADMVSGMRDKLAGAAGAASDGGRSAADSVASATRAAIGRAGDYRDQAQRTFSRVLESEPLLIGAVGLIVGAAIGAALPHTELEDHAVGPLRDKLFDKGKDLAQEGLQQVGGAAQAAYDSVKDEIANPTSAGDSLSDRMETAARSRVTAAREQFQSSSN